MARKRKDEGHPPTDQGEVLPPARFVAPLRKPADVTMERKRLYRAVLNGKVTPDTAARLNYMLNGIRTDLEADAPPVIDQTTRGPCVEVVMVSGVPSGEFLPIEEIQRLESQFVEQPPAHLSAPPMLKLYDSADDTEEPPPQAA